MRSRWLNWTTGRTESSGDPPIRLRLSASSLLLRFSKLTRFSRGRSAPPTSQFLAPRNAEFESGDWLKSVIWDANRPYKDFTKLNLNLNDTEMLLEVQNPSAAAGQSTPLSYSAPRLTFCSQWNGKHPLRFSKPLENSDSIRSTCRTTEPTRSPRKRRRVSDRRSVFSKSSTPTQPRNCNYLSSVFSYRFRLCDSVADEMESAVQDTTHESRRSSFPSSTDPIRNQHPIQLYESSFVEEEEGQEDRKEDQESRRRQHSYHQRYQSARHEQFRSVRIFRSSFSASSATRH